jgi:hypothetical protein
MWPYWFLFLIPAFQAVSKLRTQTQLSLVSRRGPVLGLGIILVITLMIGLRHQVGGDWVNYLDNMEETSFLTLSETFAINKGDPADGLVKWVALQSGFGIYLVNFFYAMLFTLGLVTFCQIQPRQWLALTVAVPYLIIVVAMGYSRQGAAIGLVMLGLTALEKTGVFKFVLWVTLAALFHKSAIILLPLAAMAGTKRRFMTLFWVCVVVALLFLLLLQEHLDYLVSGYITDQYESSGAAIRIAMNALPGAVFLLLRNRFQLAPAQRIFWSWMALGSLAFVALLYISPSSTAVDRVALYWIPLQMFVWSRLPDAMGNTLASIRGWVYAVVVYSASVQVVWLFFATHSVYWLPYQFYPWVWLWQ